MTPGDQIEQVGLRVTPGVQLGQDGLGEPGNFGQVGPEATSGDISGQDVPGVTSSD